MTFAAQVPLWVWPLFIVLVGVGLRTMRPRRVPVWAIYLMPALVVLALQSFASLDPGGVGWLVFAMVWLGSVFIGFRLAKYWILRRDKKQVHLRGEKGTLTALMVVFCANFAVGVLEAVAPAARDSVFVIVFLAGLLAAASGQFAGRALWVKRA